MLMVYILVAFGFFGTARVLSFSGIRKHNREEGLLRFLFNGKQRWLLCCVCKIDKLSLKVDRSLVLDMLKGPNMTFDGHYDWCECEDDGHYDWCEYNLWGRRLTLCHYSFRWLWGSRAQIICLSDDWWFGEVCMIILFSESLAFHSMCDAHFWDGFNLEGIEVMLLFK